MSRNVFEQALKSTLADEVSVTENGAVGFKTTGKKLLDLNFAASSLRNRREAEVEKMFSEAYYENPLLAIKWMFMLRDIRGNGMGERRSFRICLKWLARVRPDVVKKLIKLVADYGRFDDLFCLISKEDIDATVEKEAIDLIDTQLAQDVQNMALNQPVSLLAKWLPSCNASSPKTIALGKHLAKKLSLTEKQYRKTLSAMRKHLNVIEQKMSAKQWSEIDYEAVPSKANLKYKNAFLRNDAVRRNAYLASLEVGEVKINSSACFPSDIVHEYVKNAGSYFSKHFNPEPALEAMWQALPDIAVDGNVLAVADGSGSMCSQAAPKSSVTALEVCNALAIYCAEHCTGPFNNRYITFSDRPQYVDLSKAQTLAEKLGIAFEHDECANTNLEATFDLVLQTAVKNNLTQKDIPTLVILSDMELDEGASFDKWLDGATSSDDLTNRYSAHQRALMEKIRQKWAAHNLNLPRTIWWNICGRTGTIPLTQNPETGIVLCSGYSQSQFKLVASGKADPYEVLLESLSTPRYQPVEDAVKAVI